MYDVAGTVPVSDVTSCFRSRQRFYLHQLGLLKKLSHGSHDFLSCRNHGFRRRVSSSNTMGSSYGRPCFLTRGYACNKDWHNPELESVSCSKNHLRNNGILKTKSPSVHETEELNGDRVCTSNDILLWTEVLLLCICKRAQIFSRPFQQFAEIAVRPCSQSNMGDNASVDSGNIDWNTEDVVEIENFCKSAHANLRIPDAGANGKAKLDEDAGDCAKVDVDTEDGLEIQNITWSPLSNIRNPNGVADIAFGEASSSRGFSFIKMVDYFVQMGFKRGMVEKAIEENGPENEDSIIESLLAYSALEDSPGEFQPAQRSSDNDEFWNDLSDADSYSDFEEDVHSEKWMLSCLAEMGYSSEEASIAIKTCGPDASMDELADFIYAARIAQEGDYFDQNAENNLKPRRKNLDIQLRKRRRSEDFSRSSLAGEKDKVRRSNPMIGFGVPTRPELGYSSEDRKLSVHASGPPYLYFENVALAPRGVWDTMKRFLYDIEPEFVDSKYFCAAARKRGYIHNLPISHRFALLPHAPRKIQEAFPSMGKWWPYWDTRQHLNCLRTRVVSDEDVKGVQKILEEWDGNPPPVVQKKLLGEIRKLNLVWIGRNKVAKLEPREVEELLGLPIDHTRGISLTNRYKSLGNSFQVDTVAYHLSVLKDLFPGGMNVLSLFSGIGAAEVALHRLGIPMKNVVSVEIDRVNREVIQSWWLETDQKGKLIDKYYDVQHLSFGLLKQLICDLGGFDLVIGGSPCNNLTGSNRRSRTGLEGKDSALFYHYFRIVDTVKFIMGCM